MEMRAGYKLTEVGLIPESWRICQFTEVTDLITCGIAATPSYVSEGQGFPFLSSTNVKNGKIYWRDFKYISSDLHRQLYRNNPPQKGDILYSRVGTIGEAAVVEVDFEFSVYVSLTLIKPKKNLHSYFLMQLLNSLPFKARAREQVYLGGGVGNLNVDVVRRYPIPLPSLEEQRAIALALSDMDALISGLDQLIAKKCGIKQAAMQQLLTGKQRLLGFNGKWEVTRLEELASFLKGKGLPKSELSLSGIDPCIHYGELFTQYPETIREVISRTTGSKDAFRSIANDVLMPTSDVTPRGLAKASCVTISGVILGGDILVIRSDAKKIDGSFLSYVIRHNEDQILQLVSGSTVFHLYGSDMKKFTFSMPPLPEQTAIATILSDLDSEITILETRRDKARQLKQGMMQELLTGRIRLSQSSPEAKVC